MRTKFSISRHIGITTAFVGATFLSFAYIRAERVKSRRADPFAIFEHFPFHPSSAPLLKQKESLLPEFLEDIRIIIERKWKAQSQSQKVVWGLIGINTIVFLGWQVPNARVKAFMNKNFVYHGARGPSYTLLTSAFSHQSLLHFGFNMMALNSFYTLFQYGLAISSEQTLAFYLSSATISSLASAIVQQLQGRAIVGTLGASGAVWALLAGAAYSFPSVKLGIIFAPGLSLSMEQVVPILLGIDVLGVIFKWNTFAHGAHLAGAGFGFLYTIYGRKLWDKLQQNLIDK